MPLAAWVHAHLLGSEHEASGRNESLYDMLWTRRNVASSDGSVRGKKAPGDRWKPAAEVTRLQRRLADQTAQLAVRLDCCSGGGRAEL